MLLAAVAIATGIDTRPGHQVPFCVFTSNSYSCCITNQLFAI